MRPLCKMTLRSGLVDHYIQIILPSASEISWTHSRLNYGLVFSLSLLDWRSTPGFLQAALQIWSDLMIPLSTLCLPGIGKMVRFGPNRVSVNSSTALHKIYSTTANTTKSQNYKTFSHLFKAPMIATIINDRKKHSLRKRFHLQALSASSIKGLEESMLKSLRRFCRLLDMKSSGDWTAAMDMSQWMSNLAFDTTGDLTFSRNWNLIESEENRNMPGVISEGVGGLNLVSTHLVICIDYSTYRI